jgi:FKBP-type peptidyl-prolyl cis-trans isomerase FkpA
MKNNFILATLIGVALLGACGKKAKTTANGIEYTFFTNIKDGEPAGENDILVSNLSINVNSNDSLLFETFTQNALQYLPANEPVFKEVFSFMRKGDSVLFVIPADTFFQNIYGVPTPNWLAAGEKIKLTIKVEDVLTQEQLEAKNMEEMEKMKQEDKEELDAYTSTLQNVQKTESGLMYVVVKEGNKAKKPKKGDKVSMLYSGYFTSGEMFDENQSVEDPFNFNVGLGQVIQGWDEGVLLMSEGAKYKFIIPWNLAYGERGSGPIKPYSSLVFDVELLKVNP